MTQNVEVRHFNDADGVAQAAAQAVVGKLAQLLDAQPLAHLVVTGGTVGILTLAKLAEIESSVDWARVHIWWGDERFVEKASSDRNAVQARDAWLAKASVPSANIHEFPASDEGLTLDQAAAAFAAEVASYTPQNSSLPVFDIVLLGMGPDGHVASLFPGSQAFSSAPIVIAEHNSPKPPPQRLSFTYGVINAATEVWFTVAGADKASAVTAVFNDNDCDLPAAKIAASSKTVWFVDKAAGASAI
jgi:6-phosphogluconolactonase